MGAEVQKVASQSVGELAPAADAFLAMIERAARDPQVDVEKMERLFAMRERVIAQNAKHAYSAALADMQPNLPAIVMRGEIKHGTGKAVQSRYALWEDIHAQIMPILQAAGFALSFRTNVVDGKIIVTAILSHREGHSEETSLPLPSDGSGSKNAVQAVGSSVSYGKRYTASALLNIRTIGEDDDAETAAKKPLDNSPATGGRREDDGNGKGKSAYQAKKDGDWERVSERLISEMKEHATKEDVRIWWAQVVRNDAEYKALPSSWRQMFRETVVDEYIGELVG